MSGPGGTERPPDPFGDRVALALVEVVLERGYEGTEVGEVIGRAGVGAEEFGRRFSGKEDCVQQVFEAFIADFIWHVRVAFESAPRWPVSLRAAAYAAADWIDAHPRVTRFGMVDVLGARNEMIRVRREEIFRWCAGLIDAGRAVAPDPAAVPATAAVMAVGAVAQILTQRMHRYEDPETGRMVQELMYQAVRPYLGEEIARAELRAPRPTLSPPAG